MPSSTITWSELAISIGTEELIAVTSLHSFLYCLCPFSSPPLSFRLLELQDRSSVGVGVGGSVQPSPTLPQSLLVQMLDDPISSDMSPLQNKIRVETNSYQSDS